MLVERNRELASIEAVLANGGLLAVEGRIGIGKTVLLEAACQRARTLDHELLFACGSELEAGFAFGVVRQLFERRVAAADTSELDTLLAGPAAATRPLLLSERPGWSAGDASFAVLHGLYWLAVNMAERRPLVLVVDDAHWADGPSLRWLAHLARRLEGLPLALLVALRPGHPATEDVSLGALREHAVVARPGLLTGSAVNEVVRATVGGDASDELCARLREASGGNPFYLHELLRAQELDGVRAGDAAGDVLVGGDDRMTRQVVARVRRLDPEALALAQSLAILGEGRQLRHGAIVAGVDMGTAARLGAGLVRLEVLSHVDPPRFLHPVIRAAVEASLAADEREALHRAAARLLFDEGAPPGQVVAHLVRVQPAGDPWVERRLCEAARAALEAGASQAAAQLLRRALAEPPLVADRISVLRELARAEVTAGRETATAWLDEAMGLTDDPRARAQIALEIAEAYAGLFRWAEAVDVIERALAELGDLDPLLAGRLEGELVVAGLHDARCASRVAPVLERLNARDLAGAPAEARAVATGMTMVLTGRPGNEASGVLEAALSRSAPPVENWDTRAALLWSLVTAERFEIVDAALQPMLAEVEHTGSARGLVATYSSLALLKLRLGALPEADGAARIALRVLQEGDFAPGLVFGVTVLADVAIEAGELEEAASLMALLPTEGLTPGVGSVLIPATRGRLELAQRRPAEALAEFEQCTAMFSADVWGVELRDVGYLHARSGAAQALLLLGERERAHELAAAELSDCRRFAGRRAIGVASRVAGLVEGGRDGVELLAASVDALRGSPATLERAKSLAELGAAMRRLGDRVAARAPLADALDLAARCSARPLVARIRDELAATGARPRRQWRRGVEALTPSEIRVVRLAADGLTNRQIAQDLYVTIKTVEGHLARAYAKLGVSGRLELRGALDGEKSRVGTLSPTGQPGGTVGAHRNAQEADHDDRPERSDAPRRV